MKEKMELLFNKNRKKTKRTLRIVMRFISQKIIHR